MNKPDITLAQAASYKQIVDRNCDKMINFIDTIKADTIAIPSTWLGNANEEFKTYKTSNDSEKITNILKNKSLFESIKSDASTFYSQYVSEWDAYNRYLEEQIRKQREAAAKKKRSSRR